MEQREKLIELLVNPNKTDECLGGWCSNECKYFDSGDYCKTEMVADYLLANGVVVLPCRCCECEHCDIGQNDVEQWCVCQLHFGKYIDVDPTDFCPYGERKGGELK